VSPPQKVGSPISRLAIAVVIWFISPLLDIVSVDTLLTVMRRFG